MCFKKTHLEYSVLYTVSQGTAIAATSALGGSGRLKKGFFFFMDMGQHGDISAAGAVAICRRQHNSFPLLMAPI